MQKYHNKKTTLDGETYDSKDEAYRGLELKLLERAGIIKDLRRQVDFELIPKQHGENAVKYVADFVYIEGIHFIVEDVKSDMTKKLSDYIIKRKLFKWLYPDYIFKETVM